MSSYAYPNPQAIFYQQYNMARRDEVVGILLALFLGDFGVHHFYLRRTGLGILYVCFFWTGIPAILGFIECFFMPGRVREFNAIQAAAIAASLGIAVPGWGQAPVNVTVNIPGAVPPASAVPVAGEATYVPPPMPLAVATYPPAMPAAAAQVATCASCQRSNPLGARFCSGCGAAL
ncbi:MAG: TM2 domain-containing protein [Terracidiphilus sp.]